MLRGRTITTGRLQPLASPPPRAILNRTDLPDLPGKPAIFRVCGSNHLKSHRYFESTAVKFLLKQFAKM
jgi:hypothetical protein